VLRSERGQIQASDAGSLVSGHRRWENDGVTQSLSETTGCLRSPRAPRQAFQGGAVSCAPATKWAS
jgi:hypothetical protein